MSNAVGMMVLGRSSSEASVAVRLRLVPGRGFSAVGSMPRRVSRRRRVDLRLPSLSVTVGGIEGDESRAGVAGGSGLIVVRLTAKVGGSSESSSGPEKTEALRVRAWKEDDAVLGARFPLPLVVEPRGGRPLRGLTLGGGSDGEERSFKGRAGKRRRA